jgi:hypothetical protein
MDAIARHIRTRPVRRARALLVTAVLIGGCGSSGDWSSSHAKATAVGTLGAGFVDRSHPPAPESTITPRPGSWDRVRPAKGYRVVLLTLADAVTRWADEVDADLKTITATPADELDRIGDAIDLHPDLIISVGNGLVDPLAVVTANHLSQQFLVVGAELAEPTE